MVSGEELIGEQFNGYSEFYEMKNAAIVIMQQTQNGVGIALMPFMPYSEGNIKIFKQSIVAEAEPTQTMVNEYNRIYGAGIEIAPASALSGLQVVS